ncbi:MAG TPA: type VI secretion system baseplate subunit TssK, partial [Vicinamibacterales bacterium]|nr:type VI secretion system baseplate subunit TssK [Vicinamibacterales bacterium]
MSIYNKVVWSEGLFLRPQHFQQQDRYFERYVETRCQALVPHSWGFTSLEIEPDLLSIGKFGLRGATGVFPDGTPV